MADLKEQIDMKTLLAVCTVLVRLLRPTRGIHASPSGYLRELGGELRRRRSGRVRRYVADMPAALTTTSPSSRPLTVAPVSGKNENDAPIPHAPTPRTPAPNTPAPHVPAPRRPSDVRLSGIRPSRGPSQCSSHGAPVPQYDPDDLARAYLRAHEHRTLIAAQRRADRTRLGVAVLCDIARGCTA